MASIKSLQNTDRSFDQYLAGDKGIIVYLESSSDEKIFDKWFREFSNIVFRSISGEKANGGCGQVISHIEAYEDDGTTKVKAYGVVDRDALLSRINNSPDPTGLDDVWWNVNDDGFSASQPFGDAIYVLHRWELENYLLQPSALRKVLGNETNGDISLSEEEIASLVIENESDLIAVTVFATCAGQGGNGRFQEYSGDDLWEEIKKYLPNAIDMSAHKEKIRSFAEGNIDPIARWDRLSRLLDGKRVMHRLDDLLAEQKFRFKTRCHYLADYVTVDPHLHSWLSRISK